MHLPLETILKPVYLLAYCYNMKIFHCAYLKSFDCNWWIKLPVQKTKGAAVPVPVLVTNSDGGWPEEVGTGTTGSTMRWLTSNIAIIIHIILHSTLIFKVPVADRWAWGHFRWVGGLSCTKYMNSGTFNLWPSSKLFQTLIFFLKFSNFQVFPFSRPMGTFKIKLPKIWRRTFFKPLKCLYCHIMVMLDYKNLTCFTIKPLPARPMGMTEGQSIIWSLFYVPVKCRLC